MHALKVGRVAGKGKPGRREAAWRVAPAQPTATVPSPKSASRVKFVTFLPISRCRPGSWKVGAPKTLGRRNERRQVERAMNPKAADGPMLKRHALPFCAIAAGVAGIAVAAVVLLATRQPSQTSNALLLGQPPLVSGVEETARPDLQRFAAVPGLSYRVEEGALADLRYSSAIVDLAVQRVGVSALDPDNWPPHYADFRLSGLDAELRFPGVPPYLRRISGDAILAYRLHPESDTLEVPLAAVSSSALGRLTARLSLDGLDAEAFPLTLARSRISTLDLDFVDQGLFAAMIAEVARSQDMSEADARKHLSAVAQMLKVEANYPFMREILAAVEAVAEHEEPGLKVALSATPAEPYPLASLSRLRFSPLPDLRVLRGLNLRVDVE